MSTLSSKIGKLLTKNSKSDEKRWDAPDIEHGHEMVTTGLKVGCQSNMMRRLFVALWWGKRPQESQKQRQCLKGMARHFLDCQWGVPTGAFKQPTTGTSTCHSVLNWLAKSVGWELFVLSRTKQRILARLIMRRTSALSAWDAMELGTAKPRWWKQPRGKADGQLSLPQWLLFSISFNSATSLFCALHWQLIHRAKVGFFGGCGVLGGWS